MLVCARSKRVTSVGVGLLLALVAALTGAVSSSAADLVVTTTTLKLNADGTGTITVTTANGSTPVNAVDMWIDNTWQRAYTLNNGTAAVNLGTQPLGDHWVAVRYRNSATHAASTAGLLWTAPGTVQVASTTTLSLNPDGTGTVRVTMANGALPTNPVDMWIDNTWQRAYTLSNGTAAIALGPQSLGDHKVTVRYRNSSTAAASETTMMWTAPGTVAVPTTTALTLNPDGTGTVTVTIANGSALVNSVDLWIDNVWQRAYTLTNGSAAIALGTQTPGDHKVTVRYRNSSTQAASEITQTWTAPGTVQAATTTALKLNADGTGTVTVTTANGTAPTNPVDLWVDNTWQRAYTLTNGSAAIALGTQTLGDHKITVRYRPSTTHAASAVALMWTTPGTVAVPTTTTLDLNADGTGGITGRLTGTIKVTVSDGSAPVNAVDLWIDNVWQRAYSLTNGSVGVDLGTLPGGDHKITVRYRPSSTAAASTASLAWLVVTADQQPTSTTITVLPDGTGTISVDASGQPGTSAVDMWVGARYKGAYALTNGRATFALGSRAGGDVQVSARYRPNATQLASTAQAVWSVDTAPTPAPGACGATILKANGTPWSCTFADDFDGTTLNSALWRAHPDHYTGGEVTACNVDSPSTVAVREGALHLSVIKGAMVTCTGLDGASITTPYAAGRVTTYHTWSQQYGRFEARVMTTASTAPGLHEGFWMWPDTRYPEGQLEWPYNGEIDVAEMRSNDPHRAVPFLHSADDLLGGLTSGSNANTAWDCAAERGVWNTYAMEWSPDRIEIFVNGESCLVNTAGNEAFRKRYIMVLSQGLGALSNTLTSETTVPATMTVDYVRAWS